MMNKKSKVLVTGGAGYIGSVLVPLLLQKNYSVRVLDKLLWGGQSLLPWFHSPNFEFLNGDIRNQGDVHKAVQNVDAIVHLAAIVGDPACRKEPDLARQTNYDASVLLYQAAEKFGVKRFLFASTCSNYGKMTDPNQWCVEDCELRPVSLYAELKVQFENYLLTQKNKVCSTALRFSTAYGLSPRMRFDLTVNEFTRDAVAGKKLVVFGEQFWRPYCHTIDLARACLHILETPENLVGQEAINVGDNTQNYQKEMIIAELKKQIPEMKVEFVHKDEDPRDYRVLFDKIQKLGFRVSKRVPDGIAEISSAIHSRLILNSYDSIYSNMSS